MDRAQILTLILLSLAFCQYGTKLLIELFSSYNRKTNSQNFEIGFIQYKVIMYKLTEASKIL